MTCATARLPGAGLRFIVLAALLLPAGALPVRAEDCTWGQPGYRDCVDAKIKRRKEAEAQGRKPEPAPTVPASKRPGSLTPLPAPPSAPPRGASRVGQRDRALQDSLRQFDREGARMRSQGYPEPMMPYPEINKIPGRICPSGGCD